MWTHQIKYNCMPTLSSVGALLIADRFELSFLQQDMLQILKNVSIRIEELHGPEHGPWARLAR